MLVFAPWVNAGNGGMRRWLAAPSGLSRHPPGNIPRLVLAEPDLDCGGNAVLFSRVESTYEKMWNGAKPVGIYHASSCLWLPPYPHFLAATVQNVLNSDGCISACSA
jgi:hypothetical protein